MKTEVEAYMDDESWGGRLAACRSSLTEAETALAAGEAWLAAGWVLAVLDELHDIAGWVADLQAEAERLRELIAVDK